MRINFIRQKDLYSFEEKKNLGEYVNKCKINYDIEVYNLKGKTRNDAKRKRNVAKYEL